MAYDIKIKTDGTKIEIQNPFVDDYYTKVESDTKYQPIGDYVTESQLEEKGYITTLKTVNGESLIGEGDIVIHAGNDGYTKEEADAKFQPKGEYLTAIPDNYITEDELNSKGYITIIPDEYVTDSELAAKGYITEHQPLKTINGESLVGTGNITIEGGGSADLTNYYTRGEVDNLVAEKARIVSLTQAEYDALDIKDENTIYNITDAEPVCYTKAESDERFLTEHQPLKTINGESIVGTGDIIITGGGGGSTDLTDYYTKGESDERFQPIGAYLTEHQPLKTINGESLVGSGNITIEGSAPSNVVTTNTTQTITGQKKFAGSVIFDGGAEFHNEIRFNNGIAGDVDIAMGIACAFKVKPAQISNFYTYKIFPGNYGESDGKVHFRDFDDTTDYAVIDSTGISELGTPLSDKYQAILVSGTNIKTINGNSILGSGDITITGGGGSADLTNYYTKSEIDSMIGDISNLLSQI